MTTKKSTIVALLLCFVFGQLFGPQKTVSQTKSGGQDLVARKAGLSTAGLLRPAASDKLATPPSAAAKSASEKSGGPRPAAQGTQAPEGDYGDAPDGSLAGYEEP